ncbi:titin [Echeneis naucrates]|uniref:titin n=1 Tax=Echeneis naucrates TaxID=173247 RepID=UPI001113E147|nr:titin-like [Echeneis naucrates]
MPDRKARFPSVVYTSALSGPWKMGLIKAFSLIYFLAVCVADDTEKEIPVPILKSVNGWLDVFPTESVVLSCGMDSDSGWEYTWNKDGLKVEPDDIVSFDTNRTTLSISSASAKHAGDYSCQRHLKGRPAHYTSSSTVTLTVYGKAPTPTLIKEPNVSPMYVGETVNFTCNVGVSSGWNYEWFKGEDDLPKPANSKTINLHLSLSDKGNYSCRAYRDAKKTPLTEFSADVVQDVREIPVPILKSVNGWLDVFPTESVVLSCGMDSDSGWEYTWNKDGLKVEPDDIVSFDTNRTTLFISSASAKHAGDYSCKGHLKGRPVHSTSSSTVTLTVYDKKPSVILTQDPDYKVMFPGESVSFSCHINVSSGWEYVWHKGGSVLGISENKYLVNSVGKGNSGLYTCKAKRGTTQVFFTDSSQVNLEVKENTPDPTVIKGPDFNPMYVGETVNFTCNVGVSSGWNYKWYKGEDDLPKPANSKTINLHLSLSDKGNYSCSAKRGEKISTGYSADVVQDVREIPVPVLKSVNGWLDVFPTESVVLSCGMDSDSGWEYTWNKDGLKVEPDDIVSFDTNRATLSISSASAKHAGDYSCKGHLKGRPVHSTSSSTVTLTVYDKKPSVILTQDPDYKVMFPGESVSFSCHINVSSGWEYVWHKGGSVLGISENKYLVNSVGKGNSGLYTCKAKRGTTQVFFTDSSQVNLEVKEKKPTPLVTREPDSDKLYAGESVSLNCKVPVSSGWEYQWYKDEENISSNSNFIIHNASSSDNGIYKCRANRDKSIYKTEMSDERVLQISEIPVPVIKNITPWLDIFPTESVKMECEMHGSSDWKYIWYKDGKAIQSSYSDQTTLSISSASASNHGQYTCRGMLKSRPVNSYVSHGLKVSVYDTKPRVTVIQNPEHDVMHTGDSVSLSCHVNFSSGWTYVWYKDGAPSTESGIVYNISSVVMGSTGSYTCQVKRGQDPVFKSDQSKPVKLSISERPQASIILLTGWSEVFSTNSLVLKCMVDSADVWNYTWFKDQEEIHGAHKEKHHVTPTNDPEQSSYTCHGIRTGRPSYSKPSASLKTKNLLLKRRILLSISGCLFFGLIAVFLGCIFLRVFRKPAGDEDKPEEENLFLTMAQMKDRMDAPCPLVDYITDAELNPPSKEGEENGVICSETTPLSAQEDQEVKTEIQDTEENNDGLVSFKQ